MPNEIYHKSNWGNANAEGFGDVYFDAAATNKLYNHSDYYENSNGTDKILRDLSNKASIVLTPTAYSDGSLNTVIPPYQVLPQELVTNGDFSDGTNDWSTSNSTLSLDNGYLKITSTGGNRPQANQTVLGLIAGKKYRLSAEAKRGTCVNGVEIEISGIGSTVDTNKNNTTEFKDIFYEFTATSTTHTIQAKIDDGSSTVGETAFFKIVNLKEIQEADFDFSRGSSATRVNEKGLIESIASGLPRIDYTSGFGSLLLEPQRTNLVPYSEDFSQWTATTATVSTNQIISPDGTLNADKITINSDALSGVRLFTQINAQKYNFSCYIKKGTTSNVKLYIIQQGVSEYKIDVDLDTGTLGAIPSGITDAKIHLIGNGWYRVSCSRNFTASASNHGVGIIAENNNGNDFYIWGAQLEAGSYATSYIPTSGSTVTRSADVANNSGNADLINSTEGVLYLEAATLVDPTSVMIIGLSDGTNANRISITFHSTLNRIQIFAQKNSVQLFNIDNTSVSKTNFNKIAISYNSTSAKFFLNGTLVASATPTDMFTANTLDRVNFDIGNGANDFYGKTKELAVFKEALTDAELENLTSWVSFTEMATDLEYTLE